MKRSLYTLLFLTVTAFMATAQQEVVIERELRWKPKPVSLQPAPGRSLAAYQFAGAAYRQDKAGLPVFQTTFPVAGPGRLQVTIEEARYEPLAPLRDPQGAEPASGLEFFTSVEKARDQHLGTLSFIPIVAGADGQWRKLSSFRLRITLQEETSPVVSRGPEGTDVSVLAAGETFKLEVRQTGIYKLTYNYLRDVVGLAVDDIDPRNLRIYGNGGGILPRRAGDFRYDDLEENPIFVAGEADGSLDPGDYLLFYAEEADVWGYDEQEDRFDLQQNPFSDENYYFLKVGSGPGRRLETASDLSDAAPPNVYTATAFDEFRRLEEERSNLLYDFGSAEGSGQQWFGDGFRVTRSRLYNDFVFPNLRADQPVKLRVRFAGRSAASTTFSARAGGETFSFSIPGTDVANNVTAPYARIRELEGSFFSPEDQITVTIDYPEGAAASEGWLDFIQLNARRDLIVAGDQLAFRDAQGLGQDFVRYELEGASASWQVWDITDPVHPRRQEVSASGGRISFTSAGDTLRQYIALDPEAELLLPNSVGLVANQNLHGFQDLDMLIVYHPDFTSAVQQLVAHRSNLNGFSVGLATVEEIYNEFSSGRQDPTAIRDFARLLYQRDPDFNYLLLFGDGSFDYRNKLGLEPGRRHHFVPTFETEESLNPLFAYPTDDYFGLLDDEEGNLESGKLDLAIGRLPVKTPTEAAMVVQKIIDYETDPEYLRDWRNRIVFMSDDEDSNLHLNANEDISQTLNDYPFFNLEKIYFDAYPEQSTSGGDRYPDAKNAINNNMFKGALVMNYMGHGGPTGWAQERVLTLDDIESWNNRPRLPLMITATCSFTGFDEPNFVSGGERTLLNERGGVVAIMTTVRAVFAQSNEVLVTNVFEYLFDKENGQLLTIGESLRRGTNDTQGTTTRIVNSRKFALIGDPAMRLGLPQYQVVTSEINGSPVGQGTADTVQALSQVTVKGFIAEEGGQELSDFNGRVFVTLFDKTDTLFTLGQGSSPTSFALQRNVLFKGAATVTEGRFSITFVVPRDINYQYGFGKLSYYAENGEADATGFFDRLVIGGTDPNGVQDDEGPLVEVFMNDENFVLGGITDEDPVLLVRLTDDNGINIAGSSIGHDLTGVLDDDQANRFLLNDFYEAEIDDYTRGAVRYPLFDLEEGRHTVRVKAWDVANNSGEGFTEFIVASSEAVALERVLNYPNPFTTNTWFEFEHNHPGLPMDVQIDIYTVSGSLVKTLQRQIMPQGLRVTRQDGLQWDGADDFGDRLARGVYLYKVKVRIFGANGEEKEAESEFEKLVILK